ncbi:RCC1 domain-containing protein [Streptomyces sp. NPDC002133]
MVAVGRYFSLALLEDGTVHAWGDGTEGQLGNGTTDFGWSR